MIYFLFVLKYVVILVIIKLYILRGSVDKENFIKDIKSIKRFEDCCLILMFRKIYYRLLINIDFESIYVIF